MNYRKCCFVRKIWCHIINYLLTSLARDRTGEYWPSVVFVRTERSEVRTAPTSGQYSPVRPSRSVSKKLLFCQILERLRLESNSLKWKKKFWIPPPFILNSKNSKAMTTKPIGQIVRQKMSFLRPTKLADNVIWRTNYVMLSKVGHLGSSALDFLIFLKTSEMQH